ncbi:MAG: calcium/sodium antiporter [Cyclobacteriaceae bacterium]|jgi:cation:H+ antiporter|nr:calcium/sodium antiporter [Cyclobacteriaceae bacterium]
MIALTLTLLIAGFIVLIKGADWLVAGASSTAKKLNISNLAIGLTVVAFGTSMPEMVVNIISATSGRNDAAFGNIIGSNNFNLLMILGLSGMIYPLVVQKKTVSYEVPLSLVAALLLYILVNDQRIFHSSENILSRTDGIILLVFFGIFLAYIYRTMKTASDFEEEISITIYPGWKSFTLIAIGLIMLIGGGKLVVDNAVELARHFGLSEKLIGLTILAAGTSLPELATSAVAAFRRNTDIAIGNVVGSNIFNISLILGVNSLITPIPFNLDLNFDLYILVIATIVLLIFMFTLNTRKLDRWEAVLLFLGYLVYTYYLVSMEQK